MTFWQKNRAFLYVVIITSVILFNVISAYSATDVTAGTQIINGRLEYDRLNKSSCLSAAIKITGDDSILTPIRVIITSISDSRVTLQNPDGYSDGVPYFEYNGQNIFEKLQNGQTTEQKKWIFSNPLRLRFTYTTQVIAEVIRSAIVRTSIPVAASTGGIVTLTQDQSEYCAGLEVVIPPGALKEDKVITVAERVGNIQPPPNGLVIAGLPVQLGPAGTVFNKPVTVRMPYTDEELIEAGVTDPSLAKISYFDSNIEQWVEVPVSYVDTANRLIVFDTTHFSIWSKLWPFGNTKKDLLTYDNARSYVQTTWKIVAPVNDINRVIFEESLPYFAQIGSILTWESMWDSIGKKNYADAAKKGGTYLSKFGLKAAGYSTTASLIGLSQASYGLLEYFATTLDKEAFNIQVSFYVQWRQQGAQSEEIVNDYVDDKGWVLNPSGAYSWNPNRPDLLKIQPADVYAAGEQFFRKMQEQANGNIDDDNAAMKADFENKLLEIQNENLPTAKFNIHPSFIGNPPFSVSFDPSESSAIDGRSISTYSWYMDLNPVSNYNNAQVFNYIFNEAGTYTIKLIVTDNMGESSSYSQDINVTLADLSNIIPTAQYSFNIVDRTVNFDASQSTDTDGEIVRYEWDFGDGFLSEGEVVSHGYTTIGNYTVKLKVTDNDLYSVIIEKNINLTDSVPDLNAGLVAYYPFNGNANDESGNGNNGVVNGELNYVSGVLGQAANFDGLDDFIEIRNSSSLNPSEITISTWIMPDSYDDPPNSINAHHIVVNKENQYEVAVLVDPYLGVTGSEYIESGELTFAFNTDMTPVWLWQKTHYFPELNNFINVVATFNNNNMATAYVNGQEVSSFQYNQGLSPTDNVLRIGARLLQLGAANYAYFNGIIDEVRIYNRALSEEEIQALYNEVDITLEPTSRIPDTGQTTSYTDVFGEDSDYTINPQSYTKLDYNGNDLPDNAASWAMVRDNVTGLIWENKTDDGGIHDKDNTYNWQNTQDVFIAQLNDDNFGGHDDWRMPTVMELSMLVNADRSFPSINTSYFSNTVSSYFWSDYWSSTTNAHYADNAWHVKFSDGRVHYQNKSFNYYARAVRGGQSDGALLDNGDGTVTDTKTGLMWQQDEAGGMGWTLALTYCENLELAGHDDWRLPNRNELQSIVDYQVGNPAVNKAAFPGAMWWSGYWSSTAIAYNSGYAWSMGFSYGYFDISNKSNIYYVRAVRGGQ